MDTAAGLRINHLGARNSGCCKALKPRKWPTRRWRGSPKNESVGVIKARITERDLHALNAA